MEMSFEADDEGRIQIAPGQPYTPKELAKEVGESVKNLQKIIQILVDLGMISYQNNVPQFLSWNQRQFGSDIGSAERTRKWRSKKSASQEGHGDVTDTGKKEKEKEKENNNNPTPTPSLGREGDDDDLVCVYCGVKQSEVDWAFDLDHFIPRQAGGSDKPENKVLSCHTCNQIKSKRIFKSIEDARKFIRKTLWDKNRARYEIPRKVCFGGKPPEGWELPKKKADRALPPYSLEFEEFYQHYPNKKGGKEEAWAIWQRRLKNSTLPPINYLMECVYRLSGDQDWMEYAPMVTTFLNKGRWTDVDALKSTKRAPPPNPPDPNCPYCKGFGQEPVEKNGVKGMTICRCRKGVTSA
jgi:5-methylcytosine-specific restriction endonuclease McrA